MEIKANLSLSLVEVEAELGNRMVSHYLYKVLEGKKYLCCIPKMSMCSKDTLIWWHIACPVLMQKKCKDEHMIN